MNFSLIVAFRDREVLRVKRCLDSLHAQSYTGFELLFVDSGSKTQLAEEVKEQCTNYSFCKYIYNQTQGWFWNKSQALNIAITQAQGEWLVVVDIDMIYSPNFLEIVAAHLKSNTFLHYHCFYLPQNFKNYNNLEKEDLSSYRKSNPDTATGLLICEKKIIQNINGYDEYFKIWGGEDMDIHHRLKKQLSYEWIEAHLSPVFHQWHPVSHRPEALPKGWRAHCHERFQQKKEAKNTLHYPFSGQIILQNERPVLPLLHQKEHEVCFEFERPLAGSIGKFVQAFFKLESNEFLHINQTFESITASQKPSRLARIFSKLNRQLERTRFSYRITDLAGYQEEIVGFYSVRDFLFYFLHYNQNHIRDYYWEADFPSIKLWILKV